MLLARPTSELRDNDYARFARFYLKHSEQFDEQYMLHDALLHLITTIPETPLLLLDDEEGRLAGFIQYRYMDNNVKAFIESAILIEAYRSSRAFFHGFRDLVRVMLEETESKVQHVHFHAAATNDYVNRLYGKFARFSGSVDRNGRIEHVYVTGMDDLLRYLVMERPERR